MNVGVPGGRPLEGRSTRERGVSAMRVRYVADVYTFGGPEQSLDRHYRELRDELLGQGRHYALPHHAVTWRPPADIHETTDAVVVKLELAGVHEEQLEITVY